MSTVNDRVHPTRSAITVAGIVGNSASNDTVLTVGNTAQRPSATWQTMCDDSYAVSRGAKPLIVRPDGRMILTNGSGQQTFSLSVFYPL